MSIGGREDLGKGKTTRHDRLALRAVVRVETFAKRKVEIENFDVCVMISVVRVVVKLNVRGVRGEFVNDEILGEIRCLALL